VDKKVRFALEKEQKDKQSTDEAEAYIMSLVNKALSKPPPPPPAVAAQASATAATAGTKETTYDQNAIKSILKRAKNGKD